MYIQGLISTKFFFVCLWQKLFSLKNVFFFWTWTHLPFSPRPSVTTSTRLAFILSASVSPPLYGAETWLKVYFWCSFISWSWMCLQPVRQNDRSFIFLFLFGVPVRFKEALPVNTRSGDDVLRHHFSLQHATACRALSILQISSLSFFPFFFLFLAFFLEKDCFLIFSCVETIMKVFQRKAARLVCVFLCQLFVCVQFCSSIPEGCNEGVCACLGRRRVVAMATPTESSRQ